MMKKALGAVLALIFCLTGTLHVYAAGVQEPVIESEMPDCYIVLGEHVLTLYTDAISPDGGTLEYQWYSTTINDIATIRAIDEETGGTFTPPQTVGVVYYCYAVLNNKSGLRSNPVYSRLIRVEYAEGEPTVESIEILSTPDKVVYTSGERLDLTGLKVRIWMSDGYIDSVNGDQLEITTNPLVTVGEQKIKVTYRGVSDFFIVTVEAAPHTHSFGEWMIVTNLTCTEAGIRVRECDCGHTERSEVAATGHQWDGGKVTKEPTENSDGERTFTCTVCKKTRTEAIKAAVVSEPSDHVNKSETIQSENLSEKSGSTGNTDPQEDSDHTSTTERNQRIDNNPSLPEKGETSGEPQSSDTEQSSMLSWWIIAAIALILVVGAIIGTIILWKRKSLTNTDS